MNRLQGVSWCQQYCRLRVYSRRKRLSHPRPLPQLQPKPHRQRTASRQPPPPANAQPPGGNRVFGVFPNYRTADMSQIGTVLTPRQKFSIAAKDSFDYPTVLLAAAVAGIGQWSNSNPSFGQGAKGYGHRWITSYADQAIGNMLTEGVYPVLLHEDPRYFRRGTGSTWRRLGYAVTRVVVTQRDGGGSRFNAFGVARQRHDSGDRERVLSR